MAKAEAVEQEQQAAEEVNEAMDTEVDKKPVFSTHRKIQKYLPSATHGG